MMRCDLDPSELWFDPTRVPEVVTLSALRGLQRTLETRIVKGGWLYQPVGPNNLESLLRILEEPFTRQLGSADPCLHRLRTAMRSELLDLYGKDLTSPAFARLALRLAGWQWHWGTGRGPQGKPERQGCWAAVLLEQTLPAPTRRGLYSMELLVEAGPLTGARMSRDVSGSWLKRVARACMPQRAVPPMDLGGWRSLLWIEGDWSIDVNGFWFDNGFKGHNQALQKARGTLCSGPFQPGQPCHVGCPLGRTRCRWSRHPDDWPLRVCLNNVVRHKGYIAKAGFCGRCLRNWAVDPSLIERKDIKEIPDEQ
jgi:hypothetical protein